MKYKTTGFKGSKRKLLPAITKLTLEVEDVETFYDGFSGSGIVSAHMRHNGLEVFSSDKSPSAALYAGVFLNGFDKDQLCCLDEVRSEASKNTLWVNKFQYE